jgi:PIN domain nuclease of toxin-antitoxin system
MAEDFDEPLEDFRRMRRETADTHTFSGLLAAIVLSPRQLIEDRTNERLLSIASLWEMAIKASLGRLTLTLSFTDIVAEHVHGNAIELFEILPSHLDVLTTLPFHHKDPFDRMLIAQSQAENMPILSRDSAFDDYAIRRLWS